MGGFIAYNILRRQMKHMAQRAKFSPLRISFHIASIGILNILRFDSLDSAGNLLNRTGFIGDFFI